jgi:hypothetical protein
MKTNLLLYAAIVLMFAGSFYSCEKESELDGDKLEMGLYEEVTNLSRRGWAKIDFIDPEKLIIIRYFEDHATNFPNVIIGNEIYRREYKYEITSHKIRLTSAESDLNETIEHHFRIIHGKKFEIGFLFASIGSPPNMIFKKQ